MTDHSEDKPAEKPRSHRGFAAMDPAKRIAIATKGGSSVPPEKRSFSQNRELATEAGRTGGGLSRGGGRPRKPTKTRL
jgi:general stress protein YciG